VSAVIHQLESKVAGDCPYLTSTAPMSIAEMFLNARFRQDAEYTLRRYRGEFYSWNGCHYVRKDEETMRAYLYSYLEHAQLPGSGQSYQPTRQKITNVLDALGAKVLVDSDCEAPAWLADHQSPDAKDVIACSNGLLHLSTLQLTPHSPTFFNQSSLPCAYEPAADAPAEWIRFLNDLYGDDTESIETLQEMFGYLLSSDTSLHKLFLIVGPPRSGKGTIARVLTQLLGPSNVISPTLSSLSVNFGLQGFIGKTVAIVPDAHVSSKTDKVAIQERLLSISGEDSQTIDRKFMDAWTGRLSTRFLILSNELPAIADVSGAFASRFIILSLRRSFAGREDHGLTDRLIAQLPGILNWALVGLERLAKRGHLKQPLSSRDAVLELEEATSPVKAFVRGRCLVGPQHSVRPDDLFRAWLDWCAASGRDNPGNVQRFARDLRASTAGIATVERRHGEVRYRLMQGIALRQKESGTDIQ
jgi:putative DNA primase/helicase